MSNLDPDINDLLQVARATRALQLVQASLPGSVETRCPLSLACLLAQTALDEYLCSEVTPAQTLVIAKQLEAEEYARPEAPKERHPLYQSVLDAEAAWSADLVEEFSSGASEMRHQPEGRALETHGAFMSALSAWNDADRPLTAED
jgi:hypothetical protein